MFTKSLVLLALVTLMSANPEEVPAERIVNGYKEEINKVPWQAAILLNGTAWCGGVVYKKNIVLTAAHCLGKEGEYSVRAGSASKSCGGQIVKVAKEKIRKGTDLAMLFLRSKLKFNEFTNPIELADKSPVGGTPALVSGWGRNSFSPDIPGPDYLQITTVTVKDRRLCQEAHNTLGVLLAEKPINITKNEICASLDGNGACKGDSGGPLVSLKDRKLIGIVSHGFRCMTPGVYVDVARMKKWIKKTADKYGN